MAKHNVMQIVPRVILKHNPEIKKHVSAKMLDTLMNAVKVEAVFGETIVSLEPITEEEGPEFETVSFRQAVNLTPLVRCKDCKYRAEDDLCTGRGWPMQLVADDGFCEKGKRKAGGSDDGTA